MNITTKEETLAPHTKPLEIEKQEKDHRKVAEDSDITKVLIRGKELIEDINNWCRFRIANTDYLGHTRYCAVGSIRMAAYEVPFASPSIDTPGYQAEEILRKAAKLEFNGQLQDVNDTIGHDAVMIVYNKAIQMSRDDS